MQIKIVLNRKRFFVLNLYLNLMSSHISLTIIRIDFKCLIRKKSQETFGASLYSSKVRQSFWVFNLWQSHDLFFIEIEINICWRSFFQLRSFIVSDNIERIIFFYAISIRYLDFNRCCAYISHYFWFYFNFRTCFSDESGQRISI
jgi:hypothetical protein